MLAMGWKLLLLTGAFGGMLPGVAEGNFNVDLLPRAWFEDGQRECFSRNHGAAQLGWVRDKGLNKRRTKPQHRLSVMVYFKNEGHVLFEWVMHHLSAGVDHVYLIDNGSTDNFREKHAHWLVRLTKRGRLTLLQYDGSQQDAYNWHSQKIRAQTKWLTVIDMDEFIFSPGGSLSELLDSQFDYRTVREIRVHLALFGISGNLLQKTSLIAGNVMSAAGAQRDFSNALLPGKKRNESYWSFKTIASSHFDCHFRVHFHLFPCSTFGADDRPQRTKYMYGYTPFRSFRAPREGSSGFCRTHRLVPVGFQSVAFVQMEPRDARIRINHYRYQSWEHLIGVKERRGGGLKRHKYSHAVEQYALVAPTLNTPDHTLRHASASLVQWLHCLVDRGHLWAGKPRLEPGSRWPTLLRSLSTGELYKVGTNRSIPGAGTVEPDLDLLRQVERASGRSRQPTEPRG